ncbi:MAG: hypothetical protein ACYSP9_07480 [Planctomycetota bacterium]
MTKRGKLYLLIAAALLVLSSVVCGGGTGFPIKGRIIDKHKSLDVQLDIDGSGTSSTDTVYRVTIETETGEQRFKIHRGLYDSISIGQVCEFKSRSEADCN